MDSEQAARRLVRNVNSACVSYTREYATAARTQSQHAVNQANVTRSLLGEDVVALQSISKVDAAFMPSIRAAIE